MKVKSISLLIILTLIFQLILPVLVPLISYAEETQNRWDISEKGDGSVIAVLDNAGTLTISGKGNMQDWYGNTGMGWFSKREKIKAVKIENEVTNIGDNAFSNCSSLTSIAIPNSVTRIGDSAFSNCRSLTSIEIPNSVTIIGRSAFWSCSRLTSIKIPSSVISIGINAFDDCSSLLSIEVDKDNESYTSENGILFNKDKTELICYPAGKAEITYSIPSSVTSIGNSAFYECSRLTSIEIPSSITNIGEEAFGWCTSLTSIEIPSSVTSIGMYAFANCRSLTNIKIPSSVTRIGSNAFYNCRSLTNIDVDENSQSYLSENGILFNKDKTELICYPTGKAEITYSIPSSVTSIGNGAFYECSRLTSIEIPSSITSLGESAFRHCRSLTSIEIPSSVTSIGMYAFANCRSLTSIEIPSSVTIIRYGAFEYCSNLKIYTNSDYVVSYAEENSLNYVIDKNSPTVTSVTVNPNTWTNRNVTVTINGAKDAVVGLAKKPYSFDGGVTWQAENTKTYTENTQGIQIQVRDSLGNAYKHKGINAQIDKTSPKITGVEEGKTYEVALTVTITDDNLKTVELTKDGVKVEGFKSGDTIRESGKYKLTATDEAENTSVVNFTMDIVLQVNTKYETEAIDGKYYITKVNPGTTIETFKNNISTNGTIKIYKGTTEITDISKKIATGMTMKVQLGNKEVMYEIIVTGDLNGDGEMNNIDLLRLVRYKAGLDKTLEGSYLSASDTCKDGTPAEDKDLLKMVRVLVGLDKIKKR